MTNKTKTIALLLVFFIATSVMTFPLVFKINDHMPGYGSTDEPYGVIWDMWWYKYSKATALNYNKCAFIAYPFGMDFSNIAGATYFWEAIKHIFVILTNAVVTYNLLILFSFFLTLITTYCLLYYITRSGLSSLFSAFIFAFSPYHFARSWQHLSLSQIQWLPLYLLSLFMLINSPKKTGIIFTATAFFLVATFNFYYTYFSLIATAVFLIFFTVSNRQKRIALRLAGRVILALGIVALLLIPAFYDVSKRTDSASGMPLSHNLTQRSFNDLFTQSSKPLSFLLPATTHPVFGAFTERFIGSPLYGVSYTEHALYLGWIPLILAFFAFRKWRRNRKLRFTNYDLRITNSDDFYIGFFIWLAFIAWLFSQPPYFTFPYFKIYMPSFFLYKLLPMFRAYARFGVLVMLAVSVLGGYGLKIVLERARGNKAKIALTSLFCGLVLFEFLNFPPFKVIDLTSYPKVYDWLKEQKGDFAIAEYPLDTESPNEYYKFCQTIHKKKLINGTIPATEANNISKQIWRLSEPETAGRLDQMNVRYVLVHTGAYEKSNDMNMLDELERIKSKKIAGLKYVRGFDDVDVYEVQ